MKHVMVVLCALVFFAFNAQAVTSKNAGLDLAKMGWVIDKKTSDGKTHLIRNEGANGGVLSVGCSKPGTDVKIKYTYRGLNKDLFIIDLLSDETTGEFPHVAFYGVGTMTSVTGLEPIKLSKSGFIVTRFAEGAAERYLKSLKDRTLFSPPKPIGNEMFVGNTSIEQFVDEISSTCLREENERTL